jgi:two-component system sensor kinase FixL
VTLVIARLKELLHQAAEARRLDGLAELIDDLAGQINRPLMSIAANAQAAARRLRAGSSSAADLLEALEQIAGEALRAGQVVHRMHERVVADGFEESVDLGVLVAELLRSLRPETQRAEILVRFEVRPQMPRIACYSRGLRAAVAVLLLRCIETAGKYADYERLMRVRVAPATEPGAVEVGMGIGGNDPSELWGDPLIEPDPADVPSSLAVEVAVVQALIEAHGGRFWVVAEPRGLCSTRFTLPVLRP